MEKREEVEINLGTIATDIDFHPSRDLITAGLRDTNVHLYIMSNHKGYWKFMHTLSLAELLDSSIMGMMWRLGQQLLDRLEDAHSAAINRLINLSEAIIASGDDEGRIKVWDTRQRSCCNTFAAHQDYISDMSFASDSLKLLGTSGDGTLSVCDLRRNKVQAQSQFSEDELLSVVLMKIAFVLSTGFAASSICLNSVKDVVPAGNI